MLPSMSSEPAPSESSDELEPFFSIIDYEVTGHEAQHRLVEELATVQEQWVRSHTGYVSATFFASVGGDRVYNVIEWRSKSDFDRFEAESDTDGRLAAIEAALLAVPGPVEPRMTGAPRFRVVRTVHPDRVGGIGGSGRRVG